MITLYQVPYSPFCITIATILDHSRTDYRVVNLPYSDRRLIFEKSGGEYYRVPLLDDDGTAVWDRTELGQEIARHLDRKFGLGLFPEALEGVQAILARYIENEIEAVGFRLNDLHYESWLPDLYDRTMWLRHKERRFGVDCIEQWRAQQGDLARQLEALLVPIDQMLSQRPYLIDARPRFVDYDLFGILGNYNYTGRNPLPSRLDHLARWHDRMRTTASAEAAPPRPD